MLAVLSRVLEREGVTCVAGMGQRIGGLYLAGLTSRVPSQHLVTSQALPEGVTTVSVLPVGRSTFGAAPASVLSDRDTESENELLEFSTQSEGTPNETEVNTKDARGGGVTCTHAF